MSYILNILTCVDMILLDILLQCFLFIVVIDLSSTFYIIVVLIFNLLFRFVIYFWIKIKLKVLIFPTSSHRRGSASGWRWRGGTKLKRKGKTMAAPRWTMLQRGMVWVAPFGRTGVASQYWTTAVRMRRCLDGC
jgi:hypothetical protein